jgi:DNA invertase Pin-like site-specific DNA recombinase
MYKKNTYLCTLFYEYLKENVMKKVVLLVRVSSVSQDYEAQMNELIEYAKLDNYTIDDMEIIQDKESATKLSDEERQGLNKMYAAIDNLDNQIEAVYCWELSRLSRLPITLYKVRDYLISRKIDLRTKKEGFRMNNSNINLHFAIYVALCEEEITTRKERTERSRKALALKGGYGGGDPNNFIRYGYKVENKMFVIDEEKAETVKKIFQLYSTGKYGHTKLYRELTELGMNKDLNIRLIHPILRCEYYTGEEIPLHYKTVKGKQLIRYARRYPKIITPEMFAACREIARQNNTQIDKAKNIYFGNKLMKCRECGRNLKPNKRSGQYICTARYPTKTQPPCTCRDSIPINVIDTILWHLARTEEHTFIMISEEAHKAKINSKISELQNKIDTSEKQYNNILENKIRKLKTELEGYDDKEITPIAIRTTLKEKERINNDIMNFKNEIEHLKNLLPKPSTMEEQDKSDVYIFVTLDKSTDKEKYVLIHKHIKCVSICDAPDQTHTKQITVETYIDEDDDYIVKLDDDRDDKDNELIERMIENRNKKIYYYNQQNKSVSQYMATINGKPVLDNIPIVKRINPRQKNTLK